MGLEQIIASNWKHGTLSIFQIEMYAWLCKYWNEKKKNPPVRTKLYREKT